MTPIILVHGAWHGAWCWLRVLRELELRERGALAIDLPGMGDDTTPPAEMSLDLWALSIGEALKRVNKPPLLVGHSMGGLAISQAAELNPHLVGGLVYLCAYLPQDGDSLIAAAGRNAPGTSLVEPVFSEDGTTVSVTEACLRPAFYADCSDQDYAFAKARIKPMGARPTLEPVHLTPERFGRVPRHYIECLQDQAVPIDQQRAMVAASPCQSVHTLDTSHSPFLSAPGGLADILCGTES